MGSELEIEIDYGCLTGAVVAGIKQVYIGQIDMSRPSPPELKSDGTLVTSTDIQSQKEMLRMLKGVPYVAVYAEESKEGMPPGPYIALVDPLDGTGAFANGLMTSTVIAGLYDTAAKRLVACSIGEAATRRVWFASQKQPTVMNFYSPATAPGELILHTAGKAWVDRARSFGPKDYIYLDVTHAFKKGLNVDQMQRLLSSLVAKDMKFHVPGSNGLIHALVANGAPSAAGSISTAKGGPWDFCGALLVKQAGGFVRGLKKVDDKLIEHDALDPVACDFLITANSTAILEQLTEVFLTAYF